MAWRIEWDDAAVDDLRTLDHTVQQRIAHYLKTRIATDDNPRRFGKALSGNLAGLWCYRVGDYRVLCEIEEGRLTVLVVALGHRKLVYQ